MSDLSMPSLYARVVEHEHSASDCNLVVIVVVHAETTLEISERTSLVAAAGVSDFLRDPCEIGFARAMRQAWRATR
jgi:hypothetical protein